MSNKTVRVRFAPSPTGLMHIGGVRTALMNYLFAKQKGGTFILRIEDTDAQRNFDPGAKQIQADLAWLGLQHDEGPGVGGPYGPYFQSERSHIYAEALEQLKETNLVYRCFCTIAELEKKRERQIALKMPPRYDKTCLKRSPADAQELLDKKTPFIWRMQLDPQATVTITDLAHGTINFEMKNFSDFPLTREDGSFTFIFANFADDMLMQLTHVFRGEDHLTNTACQAVLYQAFNKALPVFWHLPLMGDIEGKKLSKRNFGFSLGDLQSAGFLPEAITNYLAIIGASFKQEIMSVEEIIKAFNFDNMNSTGMIKYDVEKLTWLNHKWLNMYEPARLTELCRPVLENSYPAVKDIDDAQLTALLQTMKSDMQTIQDCVRVLAFYFAAPNVSQETLATHIAPDALITIQAMVKKNLPHIDQPEAFSDLLKAATKENMLKIKDMFWFIRLGLTGYPQGPAITELIEILGAPEARKRLEKVV